MSAFKPGDRVALVEPSSFLANYHDASPGTVGIITRMSELYADDDGFLIDWGDGEEARSEPHEVVAA